MLYMVTFTINIPQMLAYIPAPWILWVIMSLSLTMKAKYDAQLKTEQPFSVPKPSALCGQALIESSCACSGFPCGGHFGMPIVYSIFTHLPILVFLCFLRFGSFWPILLLSIQNVAPQTLICFRLALISSNMIFNPTGIIHKVLPVQAYACGL